MHRPDADITQCTLASTGEAGACLIRMHPGAGSWTSHAQAAASPSCRKRLAVSKAERNDAAVSCSWLRRSLFMLSSSFTLLRPCSTAVLGGTCRYVLGSYYRYSTQCISSTQVKVCQSRLPHRECSACMLLDVVCRLVHELTMRAMLS